MEYLINQINDLFNVNNGNIYDFIALIFTLLAIPFSIYTWAKNKEKDRQLVLESNRELNNRIFIELMKEYRREFRNISLHQQDNQKIYKYHISDLKKLGRDADEIRTSVMFVIDTLKNAYSLLRDNNTSVCNSLWDEHFYYVFDPIRKPLFVSAFKQKCKEEYDWLENDRINDFVAFVEQVIKENEEKHIEKIMKK